MKRKTLARGITASLVVTSLTGCALGNENAPMAVAPSEPAYCIDAAVEPDAYYVNEYYDSNERIYGCAEEEYIEDGEDWIEFNTEEYSKIDENIFKDVSTSPLSTFSADVDTASYSNVRRMINDGLRIGDIPSGAVRAEEMINYFTYDYDGPNENEPFGVNAEISECPWNADHKLVHIGLKTEDIDYSEAPASNIVLLVDVSGSMSSSNKLPLVKESFEMMLENLSEKDTISIVTYANGVDVVLDGVSCDKKEKITKALESLKASGGTYGEGGIEEAYRVAEKNFIKEGNNRIIIASDGDFNIGKTNQSDLSGLIKEKAESGVYLSVLGYGMGNYSDTRMETLADDGNGNYAYIDTIHEAKKVLVKEFAANMLTVAKDVKFQVEFNPKYVAEYRLIGYENRALNNEDFEDDKKDAGEIGAGHSVTVLYEIVPASDESTESNLKYQANQLTEEALNSNDWFTLSVRYKEPDADESKLLEYQIGADCYTDTPSDNFVLSAAVAEFAMILKGSDYVAEGNLDHVAEELNSIPLNDEFRREFATLVDKVNL